MKSFWQILLVIFFAGVWLYRRYKANKHRQEESFAFFKKKLDIIQTATFSFANHINASAAYFTNYQLCQWQNEYVSLSSEINGKSFENIGLTIGEVELINAFNKYFINADKFRESFNKNFVTQELKTYRQFFDNIEGRKLDEQQRTAVVTDNDNNIVIAGAGSGKTTTIVGKVNYIIDRYKVSPEEILLISFTNKSATTLADRIDIKGVEAKTFHKFGKDIIVDVEEKQPSIFEEVQFIPLLTTFFNELIKNKIYLEKVSNYFTNFLKPPKTQFEFATQGEYIQYMKDINFRTYKKISSQSRGTLTYNREVVKSIEECRIANFFLFNGVNYAYELKYEQDTASKTFRQYKPDFTIIQGNKKIYVEHFGISRNGQVPSWFQGDDVRSATEKYQDDMTWKKETHKTYSTTLIETYSYEMTEGTLFINLTNKLEAAGITLYPKTPEEIWEIIKNVAKDEINTFINLFATFITLMKSNNYSISDVGYRNRETQLEFFKKRNFEFIEIIRPVFEHYDSYLRDRSEIDFSDMINKAASYIANGKYKRKFSYVVIDEFQDISIGRYQLVKAVKENNPSCKLFCVGDDWQSIYRFTGSDIALFKGFEKYFGYTVKSKIETTYRFQNPLISLSSNFILKNPNQAKKELKGTNTQKTKYKIQYSVSEKQDDTDVLQSVFEELAVNYNDIEHKKILILGRYRFDIKRIKNENAIFRIDNENGIIRYSTSLMGKAVAFQAQFLTVHKAKGLEADITIILNCNSGRYGFPSEMSDDHVLDLLLSEADQFENGEERRLFYVAMTRAREYVYFLSDSSYKSKFIAELEVESGRSPNKKCPICITADLVLRKEGTAVNGNTYKFYGCTNFLYGCSHSVTEWINN